MHRRDWVFKTQHEGRKAGRGEMGTVTCHFKHTQNNTECFLQVHNMSAKFGECKRSKRIYSSQLGEGRGVEQNGMVQGPEFLAFLK